MKRNKPEQHLSMEEIKMHVRFIDPSASAAYKQIVLPQTYETFAGANFTAFAVAACYCPDYGSCGLSQPRRQSGGSYQRYGYGCGCRCDDRCSCDHRFGCGTAIDVPGHGVRRDAQTF